MWGCKFHVLNSAFSSPGFLEIQWGKVSVLFSVPSVSVPCLVPLFQVPRNARCGHLPTFCAQGCPQPGHTVPSPGLRHFFIPPQTQAEAFFVPPRAAPQPCACSCSMFSASWDLRCLRFVSELDQLLMTHQTSPKFKVLCNPLQLQQNMNVQLKLGNGICGEQQRRKHLNMLICSENDSVKWHCGTSSCWGSLI